jgi:hypothetical protein
MFRGHLPSRILCNKRDGFLKPEAAVPYDHPGHRRREFDYDKTRDPPLWSSARC